MDIKYMFPKETHILHQNSMGGFIMKFRHPAVCPLFVICHQPKPNPHIFRRWFALWWMSRRCRWCLASLNMRVEQIQERTCPQQPSCQSSRHGMCEAYEPNVTQPNFDEWNLESVGFECTQFEKQCQKNGFYFCV